MRPCASTPVGIGASPPAGIVTLRCQCFAKPPPLGKAAPYDQKKLRNTQLPSHEARVGERAGFLEALMSRLASAAPLTCTPFPWPIGRPVNLCNSLLSPRRGLDRLYRTWADSRTRSGSFTAADGTLLGSGFSRVADCDGEQDIVAWEIGPVITAQPARHHASSV